MDDDIWIFITMGATFIAFIIGIACGSPTQLDNGCIVDNKNIYCLQEK